MNMHSNSPISARKSPWREGLVPKLCGSDVELGNFIIGPGCPEGTGSIASRLLLKEIDGVGTTSWSYSGGNYGNYCNSYSTHDYQSNVSWGKKGYSYSPAANKCYNSQDWGRKYLATNGGCVYIDLDHLEICNPEVTSAFDYVAAKHAMLLVARQAMDRANANLGPGKRIQILVNNSDGQGNSYGSHINFLLSRRARDNIFQNKPHFLAYLASYQASSIVFTGQGKVGAENGAAPVAFQLSQRADFDRMVTGLQTTYDRPLVNSRDEPLCGSQTYGKSVQDADQALARLHVIFYDSNLCHVANLLKCGMMQLVLAMIEAGHVNPLLILDDPLDAVHRISHDPTLTKRVRMASGKYFTAVELQMLFLEEAQKCNDRGMFDGVVPRAGEIMAIQADTLGKLHAGEFSSLIGRLDWILKFFILERAMQQRPSLNWNSPEIKHLDHLYSSLDPAEGLYWIYEAAGVVQRVVSPGEIERLLHEPPEDTRAFTRAMLLRQIEPEQISSIDWDRISLKLPGSSGWPVYRTLEMPEPLGLTKADTGNLFGAGLELDELLDALSANSAAGCVSQDTSNQSGADAGGPGLLLLPAPHDDSAEDDAAAKFQITKDES
jgi:Pup amidohydrolase